MKKVLGLGAFVLAMFAGGFPGFEASVRGQQVGRDYVEGDLSELGQAPQIPQRNQRLPRGNRSDAGMHDYSPDIPMVQVVSGREQIDVPRSIEPWLRKALRELEAPTGLVGSSWVVATRSYNDRSNVGTVITAKDGDFEFEVLFEQRDNLVTFFFKGEGIDQKVIIEIPQDGPENRAEPKLVLLERPNGAPLYVAVGLEQGQLGPIEVCLKGELIAVKSENGTMTPAFSGDGFGEILLDFSDKPALRGKVDNWMGKPLVLRGVMQRYVDPGQFATANTHGRMIKVSSMLLDTSGMQE